MGTKNQNKKKPLQESAEAPKTPPATKPPTHAPGGRPKGGKK